MEASLGNFGYQACRAVRPPLCRAVRSPLCRAMRSPLCRAVHSPLCRAVRSPLFPLSAPSLGLFPPLPPPPSPFSWLASPLQVVKAGAGCALHGWMLNPMEREGWGRGKAPEELKVSRACSILRSNAAHTTGVEVVKRCCPHYWGSRGCEEMLPTLLGQQRL